MKNKFYYIIQLIILVFLPQLLAPNATANENNTLLIKCNTIEIDLAKCELDSHKENLKSSKYCGYYNYASAVICLTLLAFFTFFLKRLPLEFRRMRTVLIPCFVIILIGGESGKVCFENKKAIRDTGLSICALNMAETKAVCNIK